MCWDRIVCFNLPVISRGLILNFFNSQDVLTMAKGTGRHDSLGAIAHIQLAQYVGDVVFDGRSEM